MIESEGKLIQITYKDQKMDIMEGTTLLELSKRFKKDYTYDILVAKVDNDICDLDTSINKSCTVEFFDRTSSVGNSVYLASAGFMLFLAVKQLFGTKARIVAKHSANWGICFNILNETIDQNIVAKLENEMHEIEKQDYKFIKLSVSRTDAIRYFKKNKQDDKAYSLKYISNTYVNLYRINDLYDYFYAKLAYSTGAIDTFKLTYIDDHNLALTTPDIFAPEQLIEYHHYDKVYEEFKRFDKFCFDCYNIPVVYASYMNMVVSMSRTKELINLSETYYDDELARAGREICQKEGKCRVVFLAGPSSSGKTTTSNKLKNYIKIHGINAYNISLDDYFYSKDEYTGDYDAVEALDFDLFSKNIKDLLNGKTVDMPTYNFIKGKREFNGETLKLKENDIVIVEGIHALNEKASTNIEKDKIYKIFLAPLAHLNIDDHNYIHTSDIRKLRRIVRDNKTRGHDATDTLTMWNKVFLNEKKYIYPHQDEVDIVINSFLVYEIGVLKTYVEPLLFNIPEDSPVYPEALRLINFLRNILPMPSDDVPNDSVLREFIGGSCYKI